MSKQLMIYNNIQQLSDKHMGWSVNVESYNFTSHLNSVPLLATEISLAAREFPIVFSGSPESGFIPLAVLGLTEGQNLLLDDDGRFSTRYVPAFVRRYPFVFGGSGESDIFTLCIDEDSPAVIKDGSAGARLFTENGEHSEYLKNVVEFLKDYQYRAELTRVFTQRLHELGLFESMSAEIKFNGSNASNVNLTGFFVVNRERLKQLSEADALDLFKRDGLELIYAHLQSLSNLNNLVDIKAKQLNAEAA